MEPANTAERVIAAPVTLGLEARAAFRRAAAELLDSMAEGAGTLVIDLSATRLVDSAGLGSLIQVRQHAADRRQVVRLRGVNEEIRLLLVLTKLDDLFAIEDRGNR